MSVLLNLVGDPNELGQEPGQYHKSGRSLRLGLVAQELAKVR